MTVPGENLLIKLWDSLVDKGIGNLLRPWQIRKEGAALTDVRVQEKLRLAQAERDANAILRGEITLHNAVSIKLATESYEVLPSENKNMEIQKAELIIKALTVVQAKNAVKKEVNVAKAILEAEAELENDPQKTSEESVGEDWLYRWRDYASEVSSEELQSIWGKVLAGETKNPGSFSLRTLEFLRNVTQREAETINKIAPLILGNFIYRNDNYLQSLDIGYGYLLKLQEIGVLSGVESISMQNKLISSKKDCFFHTLLGVDKMLLIEHESTNKEATIRCCNLTAIGMELTTMCKSSSNKEYMLEAGKCLVEQGFKVTLANYKRIPNTSSLEYFDGVPLNLPEPAEV